MAKWLVVKVIDETLLDVYRNINQGIGVDCVVVQEDQIADMTLDSLGRD